MPTEDKTFELSVEEAYSVSANTAR